MDIYNLLENTICSTLPVRPCLNSTGTFVLIKQDKLGNTEIVSQDAKEIDKIMAQQHDTTNMYIISNCEDVRPFRVSLQDYCLERKVYQKRPNCDAEQWAEQIANTETFVPTS